MIHSNNKLFQPFGKIGNIWLLDMNDYNSVLKYDYVIMRWCCGYLNDKQLVKFLRKMKRALKEKTTKKNIRSLIIMADNDETDTKRQPEYG